MTDGRRARYVALFAAESRTLLAGARRALAAWGDAPTERAPADELFRSLHTIKGMAASLEYEGLAELAHLTEDGLVAVRDSGAPPERAWLRELEATLDQLALGCESAAAADGVSSEPAPGEQPARKARVVRVDLDRLDALFEDLGGLVTARQDLERQAERDALSPVARAAQGMARRLDTLQDRILHVRLAPLSEVFERIPPIVRDLARQQGKEVTVRMEGDELEVDRAVLDQLAEPLIHLLRNAVDHGLESPEVRRGLGKRPAGSVVVRARRDRDSVVLELSDDGRGIDRASVAARAVAQGILEEGVALNDDGLLALLARPGFSTATTVTDVSGRGVGLDVVASRLHELGASLQLTTVPGRGTTFVVRLPTRLGIVRALVASIGDERYVMPLTHVAEFLPWEPEAVRQEDGRAVIDLRGEAIPVVDLRRLLLYRGAPSPRRRPALVLEANGQRIALLADAIHGQVDAVVQPMDRPRGMPRWITGATVLDNGRPALLLDLASVV
ncbi:MAG TPA: chemotaxis protein CheW [Gemmatimonadales bacterium]|nr:chemotaxis protein CheW [Gemmatimonadales bacterium]